MSEMASQINGASIINSTVYSGADKKKQSSASEAFVRRIHRRSVHKGPVTRKRFPLNDDVIMFYAMLEMVSILSSTANDIENVDRKLHSLVWVQAPFDKNMAVYQ